MEKIVIILFSLMFILLCFGIIHLVFTLGRLYENSVMIRELEDKIDEAKKDLEILKILERK